MDNKMERIVALCKRRGFIFQSSEIYGGLQGFWDYGPLGVELKRNVREAWWRDMITNHDELSVPPGAPQAFSMVGLETSIIMHPQVWKASGHYDLFCDLRVDCRETKNRYRYDELRGRWVRCPNGKVQVVTALETLHFDKIFVTIMASPEDEEAELERRALKAFALRNNKKDRLEWEGPIVDLPTGLSQGPAMVSMSMVPQISRVFGPDATQVGTLTEPREFNLMFESHTGAVRDETSKVFLRPETAQGTFVNFDNVVKSSRVKVPFGIAQIGKSFRNEITPRNFTFRSREFEQMEMEFFCHPSESRKWYEYWRDRRYRWYVDLGITSGNLILRDHDADELSHYSVGTADVEYAFPFLEAGEFGELEGISHRGDFDLRSHMEGKLMRKDNELVVETDADGNPKYRGSGKDLSYFDDQLRDRFVPHVIEPAAGADRATLAFLCEAYHEDQQPNDKGTMKERVLLRFHPRLAPIKAAVFPLIKKEGMPEKAAEIYRALKSAGIASYYDQQSAIGRRYRRQDEIGTPFCITVDGETANDGSVTVRDRDSLTQDRVVIEEIVDHIRSRIQG